MQNPYFCLEFSVSHFERDCTDSLNILQITNFSIENLCSIAHYPRILPDQTWQDKNGLCCFKTVLRINLHNLQMPIAAID